MKTHTIFVIQAYEELDKTSQKVNDLCTVEVIADSAPAALARAKKLIKKKSYRISNIIEKEIIK